MKYTSATEAVKEIKSGDRVYVHAAAATPTILVTELSKRAHELRDVEFCHIYTTGAAEYANPAYRDSFFVNSFFLGANVRHTIKEGNGSYLPISFSEMAKVIKTELTIDVVLIQISEPDAHGFCSLGTSVENIKAAIETSRVVIAQVNKHMPRTFGDGIIHISKITHLVEHHQLLDVLDNGNITTEEARIGSYIAELIEDKSCLQLGIGSIPNAVLNNLKNHKGLGIHTELFSDGIVPLVKSDVITGEHKKLLKGKIVSTLVHGSQLLYDFIDDNPAIEMRDASFTNDPIKISQNNRMVSINSAIEVDVTGQVSADSIGTKIFSGVGGQVDFIYGSSLSKGGKSIIALTSTTVKGANKIVPFLKHGAGVVTTRAHVNYVVTEYGVANLFGKNIKQRVKAMVEIAHPNFREQIEREYYEALSN
ncbi:4-hydroxybutyrate CoA-transferase [Empedobacter falsenii]